MSRDQDGVGGQLEDGSPVSREENVHGGRRSEQVVPAGRERPALQGPWWNLEYILGLIRRF